MVAQAAPRAEEHGGCADPRAVLGVNARAGAEEIRQAYVARALQAHPRRTSAPPPPEVLRRYQELADAYWQLCEGADRDALAIAAAGRVGGPAPEAVFQQAIGMDWTLTGTMEERKMKLLSADEAIQGVPEMLEEVRQKAVLPVRQQRAEATERGLVDEFGPRELEALATPLPDRHCRVVVVRHGMGHHNDMSGALSCANRDAQLNVVGKEQARRVGRVLRRAGVRARCNLVVVSPFTRTLETAENLFLPDFAGPDFPDTVVTPLCAEHSLVRSAIQRGDRGSEVGELRRRWPKDKYPKLNEFAEVLKYCQERGIKESKWWHHGPVAERGYGGYAWETWENFIARGKEFRRWLGSQCAARGATLCVVVSHGGLLTTTFETNALDNAEFRVFDVASDGSFHRVADPRSFPVRPPEGTRGAGAQLASDTLGVAYGLAGCAAQLAAMGFTSALSYAGVAAPGALQSPARARHGYIGGPPAVSAEVVWKSFVEQCVVHGRAALNRGDITPEMVQLGPAGFAGLPALVLLECLLRSLPEEADALRLYEGPVITRNNLPTAGTAASGFEFVYRALVSLKQDVCHARLSDGELQLLRRGCARAEECGAPEDHPRFELLNTLYQKLLSIAGQVSQTPYFRQHFDEVLARLRETPTG